VAVGAVLEVSLRAHSSDHPTVGSALGLDTTTVAPLADPNTALWAIMAAFLWRFAGFNLVVYLAGLQSHSRASTRNRRFWKAPAEFSGSAT